MLELNQCSAGDNQFGLHANDNIIKHLNVQKKRETITINEASVHVARRVKHMHAFRNVLHAYIFFFIFFL